jgi:RNA polymerase sigma-70 factor (ECF subfamily)
MEEYHHLHSSRAELLRRLGRIEESRLAYERALELVHLPPERSFLERRRAELDG